MAGVCCIIQLSWQLDDVWRWCSLLCAAGCVLSLMVISRSCNIMHYTSKQRDNEQHCWFSFPCLISRCKVTVIICSPIHLLMWDGNFWCVYQKLLNPKTSLFRKENTIKVNIWTWCRYFSEFQIKGQLEIYKHVSQVCFEDFAYTLTLTTFRQK